jgi:RNA-binding protein
MPLNNKQVRFLKTQAHSMKPVVLIGSAGLTDNVVNEINQALDDHELIKVRVNAEDREDKKDMIVSIARQTEAEHIQSIGHIGIFYRHNKKKPKIILPRK